MTLLKSHPLKVWLALGLVGLIILCAVFAEVLAPNDPMKQNLLARMKAPGTEVRGITYWLGSDEIGRDLLSRIIYGARVSLIVAALAVVVGGAIGTILGVLAGWYRGALEVLIMRSADIFLSVPAILLAIITVAILGPGLWNLVLVLAFTRWPRYARVAYGQTLSLVRMPYVRLSQTMGAGALWIMWKHILPNILGPILVVVTLEFGMMVLFEAGLSFLGLGVQPPKPSWGSIMAAGRNYLQTAWWISIFPGLLLFLLILSINFLGDYMRDHVEGRGRS